MKFEAKVNVVEGHFSHHCSVAGKKQRCGKKPVFMVFNYDGESKLSRLDSSCCEKHLARAVRIAWAENRKKLAKK